MNIKHNLYIFSVFFFSGGYRMARNYVKNKKNNTHNSNSNSKKCNSFSLIHNYLSSLFFPKYMPKQKTIMAVTKIKILATIEYLIKNSPAKVAATIILKVSPRNRFAISGTRFWKCFAFHRARNVFENNFRWLSSKNFIINIIS